MWWFAIPIVAIAAKKIYDAVSDDSSSSSSYSDNSAEKAHAAREVEQAKVEEARAQRQHAQTESMVHAELKKIREEFLQQTALPTYFSKDVLLTFSEELEVSNNASAEAALSVLCGKSIKLKKPPCEQKKLQAELAEIQQLEQFLQGI